MAPPVALLVGTVVIGVGVLVVAGAIVWPHVQSEAEELFRRFASQGQSRREQPYTRQTDQNSDEEDSDDKEESKSFKYNETREIGSDSFAPERSQWAAEGLRQRTQSARQTTSVFDFDVEMIQMDQAKSTLQIPMMPSSTRPSSRGPPANPIPYMDDNPFIEPSVPVAVAIPLPVSPSNSLLVDSSIKEQPAQPTTQTSGTVTSDVTAPSNQTLNTPTPSLSPLPDAALHGTPRHRVTESVSSNRSAASAALSPPMIPSISGSVASVRSFVARPTSPSGLSDNMSFVSAAPSRNWTDGGTADIFSGSDHDFKEADSDDDVRSVSDSGSWEDVNNTGAAGSVSGSGQAGRPARR